MLLQELLKEEWKERRKFLREYADLRDDWRSFPQPARSPFAGWPANLNAGAGGRYDPVRDALAPAKGIERVGIPRAAPPVNFEEGQMPEEVLTDEDEKVLTVLRQLDKDKNGKVDIGELVDAFEQLKYRPSRDTLEVMLREYDEDDSGELDVYPCSAQPRTAPHHTAPPCPVLPRPALSLSAPLYPDVARAHSSENFSLSTPSCSGTSRTSSWGSRRRRPRDPELGNRLSSRPSTATPRCTSRYSTLQKWLR